MIDTTKIIAAFTEFVNELAAATGSINVKAAPTVPLTPIKNVSDDSPGDTQTGVGEGSIPGIMNLELAGAKLIGVQGGPWKLGMNLAVVSETDPFAPGQGSVLKFSKNDPTDAACMILLIIGNTYSARVVNPRTYETSPWKKFTV